MDSIHIWDDSTVRLLDFCLGRPNCPKKKIIIDILMYGEIEYSLFLKPYKTLHFLFY